MTDLPSRHAYKIAVAKGLTPVRRSGRPRAVSLIPRDQLNLPSTEEVNEAHNTIVASSTSQSSVDSIRDDVFSTHSAQSTNTSEVPTAFAEGWKDAMRQTYTERPHAYTDVDRLALDIAQVLDLQMATGLPFNQGLDKRRPSDVEVELFFPTLFQSLCICDVSIIGNPIQLHSRHFSLGPRALKVGKARFLNLPRQQRHACHLSFRPGPDKRPEYVLEYTNALVSVEADKVPYILATQMDVTTSVNQLAEVLNAKFWMGRAAQRQDKVRHFDGHGKLGSGEEVDWVQLAQEKAGSERQSDKSARLAKDELITNDPNVLEFREMIEDIKHFHSEYFTLSMASDEREPFWQISYVSPTLAQRLTDVKASFNHTSPETMNQLGELLVGEVEATLSIKWGVNGEPRRLYCCPMFRKEKTCWLCFLSTESEVGVGNLWDLKYAATSSK